MCINCYYCNNFIILTMNKIYEYVKVTFAANKCHTIIHMKILFILFTITIETWCTNKIFMLLCGRGYYNKQKHHISPNLKVIAEISIFSWLLHEDEVLQRKIISRKMKILRLQHKNAKVFQEIKGNRLWKTKINCDEI